MMRTVLLSALGFLAVASCSTDSASTATTSTDSAAPSPNDTAAAPVAGTPERRTFTAADGTLIDYVLVVPDGRDVGEEGKVLFAFPPGGQDIDLAERLVRDRYLDEALARGYVVVSPAAPTTGLFYSDPSAALVPELLDAVAQQYPPEGGRFDLIGVSNGGLSAFKAAIDHPDRFRSLVVFPGYSPDGGTDPNLSALKDLGVAMYVGGEDSGWLAASQDTEATLQDLGITVELHVVPGEGHIIEGLTGAELFDALERVRT